MEHLFHKFALLLTLCVAFSFSTQAQNFDWVQTFSGPKLNQDEIHRPVSSVTDAEGNLYILGHFTPGARIGNTELLPITGANRMCVWIAKFTPSGELAWHKAIYSREYNSYAYDIRKSGDSAIMVMVWHTLPYYYSPVSQNPVYYLDTLLTTTGDLMNTDSIGGFSATAFITIDYNGHVRERHYLQMAYVDSTGATLRVCNTGGAPSDSSIVISVEGFSTEMFNLDEEGNIYVCRRAADEYSWFTSVTDYTTASVENGGISALRIIVDGERSLYYTPSYHSNWMNQQILKFSPHFDTLLDAFYVFDSLPDLEVTETNINVTAFERDVQGNLYLVLGGNNYPDTMRLMRSDTLMCVSNDRMAFDACAIAYNAGLEPYQVFQLSCTSGIAEPGRSIRFHHVTYDDASQSLYILGSVQKDSWMMEDPVCQITYRGDTLDIDRNLFWLRVDPVRGNLLAYGKARTTGMTMLKISGDSQCLQTNLEVKNNRVFSQVCYQGDISWRENTIGSSYSDWGMGVMIWDTDGHEIDFIDYGANSVRDKPGRLHITDSALWLTGIVAIGAEFDSHQVCPNGADQVYIAHYTDTAFMTPYVFIDPRIEQSIEWNQELSFALTGTPVNLTATATSGLPVTYTCADTTIARVSGNRLHLLTVGTTTVTAHQDGSLYGFYPASPVTKPLTVSSVRISTVDAEPQIQVYPNPTTGKVSITTSDTLVTATLTDMMGRSEELCLTPQADGRYSLDLTSRFNAVYLLSLTTNDGRQHTVRLLKQSDIFAK